MTHSVHFLVVYNKLRRTRCISSKQENSAVPYARADSIMHPDRGALAMGGQCHGTIGTMVNPPLDDDRVYFFIYLLKKYI